MDKCNWKQRKGIFPLWKALRNNISICVDMIKCLRYKFLVVSSRNGLWGRLLHRESIGVTLGSNVYREMTHYKPVPRKKLKPSSFSESLKNHHGWHVGHRYYTYTHTHTHQTHKHMHARYTWQGDISSLGFKAAAGSESITNNQQPSFLKAESWAPMGFLNMQMKCHFKWLKI